MCYNKKGNEKLDMYDCNVMFYVLIRNTCNDSASSTNDCMSDLKHFVLCHLSEFGLNVFSYH